MSVILTIFSGLIVVRFLQVKNLRFLWIALLLIYNLLILSQKILALALLLLIQKSEQNSITILSNCWSLCIMQIIRVLL